MITTERTRHSAHVWLKRPSRTDGAAMSCSQRAARWPFSGLGCQLARALAVADSRSQGPVLMIIDGPSGMGKSELIKHFSLQTRRDFPDALVFSSRCYERESAHYKAFDGVADSISRFLSKLDDGTVWRSSISTEVLL